MDKKNILIIGMSKTGKTHFGGQLYGRLKTGENEYSLRETPDDLSLFQDILDNLNQGLEGKHTDAKLHETVVLPVVSKSKVEIDLIYPDYGGEQLRGMIEQRKVNMTWQKQIRNSTHWFLFVRLDLIENIVDVTTKFYQQIEEEKNVKTKDSNITDLPVESSAFYVELLQTFLHVKKLSPQSSAKPRLTILLSCWDKPNYPENTVPDRILEKKMPLFSHFVKSCWLDDSLAIVGLSSLSRDLNSKTPDNEFALEGPENFGYFINENGKDEPDLTILLNQVLL
jgi:hypothetical protein